MGNIKNTVKNFSTWDWVSLATATPISAAWDPLRPLNKITEAMTEPLPEPDKPPAPPALLSADTASVEQEKAKRKRSGRNSTILTGGLSGQPTYRPTLLGQ